MSDTPVVLLNCNGVIVDNIAFDQRVTEIIVKTLAETAKLAPDEAGRRWQKELSITKGHPSWYDYAFHCDRLGLGGENLSQRAHNEAAELLTLVTGASDTLHLLQQHGLAVGVVTDATSWVVNFKLTRLSIAPLSFVFASTDAGATKASVAYWEKLTRQYEFLKPQVLVDNREVNLHAAADSLPRLKLVQFEKQEHVTTLPTAIAPKSNGSANYLVEVVHDHIQLRDWVFHHIK